jgi:hypothetical protein
MIDRNQVDGAGSKGSQGVTKAAGAGHRAAGDWGRGNNSNEMGVHHGIG